jgi:hypothetical protein
MYVPPIPYTFRSCQYLLQLLTASPQLKTSQLSYGFSQLIRVIISGYLWLSRLCAVVVYPLFGIIIIIIIIIIVVVVVVRTLFLYNFYQ